MEDEEFEKRSTQYHDHMARFIAAHRGQPRGDVLIELERRERWAKIMGPIASVVPPPPTAKTGE